MFRWKVLLQSYVSGEICSQRQLSGCARQPSPPSIRPCTGCVLPLRSPGPILIIWHGRAAGDLIPGSNPGGTDSCPSALFTRRSALGAALGPCGRWGGRTRTPPSAPRAPLRQRRHTGGIGQTPRPRVLPRLTRAWVEDAPADTQIEFLRTYTAPALPKAYINTYKAYINAYTYKCMLENQPPAAITISHADLP